MERADSLTLHVLVPRGQLRTPAETSSGGLGLPYSGELSQPTVAVSVGTIGVLAARLSETGGSDETTSCRLSSPSQVPSL
ncbi:MAG: hypothetical protein M0027_16795, partial [Candidatus Dormibacteraeota bacterium]|nr:hypothetical protein [Candidatus Dormibacteraeota bacterium]